jgi:hypothetical protein
MKEKGTLISNGKGKILQPMPLSGYHTEANVPQSDYSEGLTLAKKARTLNQGSMPSLALEALSDVSVLGQLPSSNYIVQPLCACSVILIE